MQFSITILENGCFYSQEQYKACNDNDVITVLKKYIYKYRNNNFVINEPLIMNASELLLYIEIISYTQKNYSIILTGLSNAKNMKIKNQLFYY